MMKFKMALAVAALLTMGLSSAAAYADTVTFTLTHPTEYVPATGGTLTYDATVSAPVSNGASIFLNGDSFNVTAPVTLSDGDFFSDFPLSLTPGMSFTGDLFQLTVPSGLPIGSTYLGTFTLLGGPNGGSNSVLGTVNFAIVTTPEPSSILLLLTGMAGLTLLVRSKGNLRGWAR
jgi:opacity protein-like surface antigen